MRVLRAFCLVLVACLVLISCLEAHQERVNVKVSVGGRGKSKHVQNSSVAPEAAGSVPPSAEIDSGMGSVRSKDVRPITSAFNIPAILSRWMRSFRKKWANTEMAKRHNTFKANLQKIIIHNRNPYRWADLALNQYSDLNDQEFKQKIASLNVQQFIGTRPNEAQTDAVLFEAAGGSASPRPLPQPRPKPIDIDPLTGEGGVMLAPNEADLDDSDEEDVAEIDDEVDDARAEIDDEDTTAETDDAIDSEEEVPENQLDEASRTVLTSLNWATLGKVGPMRDQGVCNSCWAFAASDALASAFSVKLNQAPASLAPQYLVDCNNQPDARFGLANFGCNGGAVQTTFRFLSSNAHILEKNYPYRKAQSTSCRVTKRTPRTTFKTASLDNSYVQVSGAAAILAEVAKAPLVVYLNAHTDEFRHFKNRIVAEACDTAVNHAVLLVGYGNEDNVDYWLIKNSWGTGWGQNGYGKIRRGVNQCGIELMGIRPVIA